MSATSLKRSSTVLAVIAAAVLGVSGTAAAGMKPHGGGGSSQQVADPLRSQPAKPHSTKSATVRGAELVRVVKAQVGKPYEYGAAGPDRFDCSGLIQYVHRQVGISVPRTAAAQRAALPRIPKSDMRPGDIIFYEENGVPYHVGLYAGNNKAYSSPQDGEVVHLQTIWSEAYSVGRAW